MYPRTMQTSKSFDKVDVSSFTRGGQELGLERSMRLLSHQNNTGSFYCCLLRKTRALPKSFHLSVPKIALKDQVREEFENVDSSEPVKKRAKIEESKVEESSSNTTSSTTNSTTNTSTNTYFQIQDSFFEFIKETFGMKKLEKEDAKCFVTRGKNGGSVSYVTKNVARHFISNQFDLSSRRNGVKLVSAGVKVFTVKNATKMYNISDTGVKTCNPRHTRVLQIGVDVLLPLLTRRVCEMSIKEMSTLLSQELGKPFETPGSALFGTCRGFERVSERMSCDSSSREGVEGTCDSEISRRRFPRDLCVQGRNIHESHDHKGDSEKHHTHERLLVR